MERNWKEDLKDNERFKETLCEIDNRRFERIILAMNICDVCEKCNYFNPTINDPMKAYRCFVFTGCIAATLHPRVQSYLWLKLGWISEKEHRERLEN